MDQSDEFSSYKIEPQAPDHLIFTFTENSTFNTILKGPDIIYEINTPNFVIDSVTHISRINQKTEEKLLVGEIAWKLFNRDLIRIGSYGTEWVPMTQLLKNEKAKLST